MTNKELDIILQEGKATKLNLKRALTKLLLKKLSLLLMHQGEEFLLVSMMMETLKESIPAI